MYLVNNKLRHPTKINVANTTVKLLSPDCTHSLSASLNTTLATCQIGLYCKPWCCITSVKETQLVCLSETLLVKTSPDETLGANNTLCANVFYFFPMFAAFVMHLAPAGVPSPHFESINLFKTLGLWLTMQGEGYPGTYTASVPHLVPLTSEGHNENGKHQAP